MSDGYDKVSLQNAKYRFGGFCYETKGRFDDPNYPQFVSGFFISASGSAPVMQLGSKDAPPVGPIAVGGAINP